VLQPVQLSDVSGFFLGFESSDALGERRLGRERGETCEPPQPRHSPPMQPEFDEARRLLDQIAPEFLEFRAVCGPSPVTRLLQLVFLDFECVARSCASRRL